MRRPMTAVTGNTSAASSRCQCRLSRTMQLRRDATCSLSASISLSAASASAMQMSQHQLSTLISLVVTSLFGLTVARQVHRTRHDHRRTWLRTTHRFHRDCTRPAASTPPAVCFLLQRRCRTLDQLRLSSSIAFGCTSVYPRTNAASHAAGKVERLA